MNKLLRICVASLFLAASVFLVVGQLHSAKAQGDNPSIASPVSAADEAAIRAILDRQTDAWNRHDMDAFVADAMPDVDWINVVGMHWKGRETVMKAHALLHKGMFANSRMRTPEITMMREIAPNVIVETHINRIEGVGALPSGAAYPDSGNLITMVFVKTQAGWRIAHAHNTTIAYDQAKKR
ncbi:SgcJ/EcaC family oxidoreductase [Bradyrhizobium sp. LTSP885]|uniref:SgcJ/EcaC family oxidoreductase n=1 Tax=Bradyrhizobium sp. LTSP885 TaxID=1619232 RepID=UPI0012E09712|nr:SgcJ/EcaC family oxidoreductase [Bradyrhizobium sp. LTSP885]